MLTAVCAQGILRTHPMPDSNLLNNPFGVAPSPVPEPVKVRKVNEWAAPVKGVLVALLPIGFGAWGSYLFAHGNLGTSLAVMIGFVIFFVLETFLIVNPTLLSALAVVDALSLASFLYQSLLSKYVLIAFAIMLVLLLFGARSTKASLKASIKILFARTANPSIDAAIIGLVIFLGAAYFFGSVPRIGGQAMSGFMDSAASSVNFYFPNLNLTTSTQNFLGAMAKSSLPANLPSSERGAVTSQIIAQTTARLESYAGAKIDLNKTPAENISVILADKINSFSPQTKTVLNVLLIVVILLSVKSLSFVLYPVLSLITYVIFQLLVAFNFAYLKYVQASQETISLEGGE